MAAKTATNPYGIDDMGYQSSVPVFFQVEMSYTEDFARNLTAQVWYVLHRDSQAEAGRSKIRLTWQRPGGVFGKLANHGVVRVLDKALGPFPWFSGLSYAGSWLTLANRGMGERACFVACPGGDAAGLYATARSIAHEFGHCCGLPDVPGPEGNLMVSTSAPSWRALTDQQAGQIQFAFDNWQKHLLAG